MVTVQPESGASGSMASRYEGDSGQRHSNFILRAEHGTTALSGERQLYKGRYIALGFFSLVLGL